MYPIYWVHRWIVCTAALGHCSKIQSLLTRLSRSLQNSSRWSSLSKSRWSQSSSSTDLCTVLEIFRTSVIFDQDLVKSTILLKVLKKYSYQIQTQIVFAIRLFQFQLCFTKTIYISANTRYLDLPDDLLQIFQFATLVTFVVLKLQNQMTFHASCRWS